MDLSIIIVNYEAWPDTVCLVQRIQQLSNRLDQSVEIIVVDNGSQTHPLAKYCEEGAGVTYISFYPCVTSNICANIKVLSAPHCNFET